MTNFIKIVNPLTHCTLSPFTISSNLRHLGPKRFFILTHSKTVSAATLILVTEVGEKLEMLVTDSVFINPFRFISFSLKQKRRHVIVDNQVGMGYFYD